MKKILLLAAALTLCASARAYTSAKRQAQDCADGSCFGQPMPDPGSVDAGGSVGEDSGSQLAPSSPRGSYGADVPGVEGARVYRRPGFLKRHAKTFLGLGLAGGGAYMALTHAAAWGLLGGPWGAAAAGAAAGLLLGAFVLPKVFHLIGKLFHRRKR